MMIFFLADIFLEFGGVRLGRKAIETFTGVNSTNRGESQAIRNFSGARVGRCPRRYDGGLCYGATKEIMKKLLIHGTALASLMILITGCHTSNLQTATGKPLLKVYQTDIKGFQAMATKHFKDRGYTPADVDFLGVPGTTVKVDDLVFERPNRQASSFIGSPSCARVYIHLQKTAGGYVAVSGDTFQVGNCHTPFENVVTSRSHYSQLQWDLNQIQHDLQKSTLGSNPGMTSAMK